MRNMRFTLSALAVLVFAALPLCAQKVAQLPKPTGYVDDYAAVLSSTAKADMEALCVELHNKTKAQVFVITVNTLDGEPIESYANDLFHTWKIGEKKTDRGALLLFAIKDHKYRIEVGYGLEGILNDAKVGDIGREMVPDLKASRYDNAVSTGLRGVVQVIADDSKVQLDALNAIPATTGSENQEALAPAPPDPPSSESVSGKFVLLLLPFVFIIGFVLFVLKIVLSTRRSGSSTGGSSFTSGSDSSSSESSSSSDDSFSGGDGGDSGGGGASGSW